MNNKEKRKEGRKIRMEEGGVGLKNEEKGKSKRRRGRECEENGRDEINRNRKKEEEIKEERVVKSRIIEGRIKIYKKRWFKMTIKATWVEMVKKKME